MQVSCVVRTTRARRPLFDNVLRLFGACAGTGAPPFEVIAALDADDAWQAAPGRGFEIVTTRSTSTSPLPWQRVHHKYLTAFRRARGEWIACMDDDDWFDAGRIQQIVSANADIISAPSVYVHELRSPARRTYLRKTPDGGVLETAIAFRRRLLDEVPLTDDIISQWLTRLEALGARHQRVPMQSMMFLHGLNADLGAGRRELRVDAVTGEVFDGPADFMLVGGRAAAVKVIGEDELRLWESGH